MKKLLKAQKIGTFDPTKVSIWNAPQSYYPASDRQNAPSRQLSVEEIAKQKAAAEEAIRLKKLYEQQELARRKQAIAASDKALMDKASLENLAIATNSLGERVRLFPDDPNSIIDDYLNPAVDIANMLGGLGQVPYNLQQGDYKQAGINIAVPAITAALARVGAKGAGQFVNNLVNPFAGMGIGKRFPHITNSRLQQPRIRPLSTNDDKYIRIAIENTTEPTNLNLEELRRIYHTRTRMLNPEERRFLRSEGRGLPTDYLSTNIVTQPPISIAIDPRGFTSYNISPLLIKKPSLVENIRYKLNTINKKLGELLSSDKEINFDELEKSINESLQKGVGIKKTDIPIKVKVANNNNNNTLIVYIDPLKDGNFVESGYVKLRPFNITKDKKASQTVRDFLRSSPLDVFYPTPKGLEKTMDFPTHKVRMSSLFPTDVNVTGVGGELGEAIKQAIKQQNSNYNLFSSTSHTNEGALRYLHDYINNRRKLFDPGTNDKWVKMAKELKAKYPQGIKKAELEAIFSSNPSLYPGNARFIYNFGGLVPNDFTFQNNELLEEQKNGGMIKRKDGGQHGGLDRWFAEKWVDVKTGKECGRQEGEKRRGYPACRPSKRISADTPKTSSELSSSEKEKFKREKTSSKRISYNHQRKQEGGDVNDREMVEGVADILSQVDDMNNRKRIAKNMISDFNEEDVDYNYLEFLTDSEIPELKSGGNVPTNPALWSRAKAAARSKYDVYPSAYANGFAAKWYKQRGGKWKKAEYGGSLPTSTLGVPYQDKEYMYKNGGEKEDWLTKLLNGTTGNIVQQTIRDQVPVVGPAYNAITQILENNPSDYARTVNIALEGLKLPAPFWGDLAINALQEGVSYMGNKNPVGIDRSYKTHFKNEKGPKYQEGGENPKDWDKFTAFNKTLPSNLRDDNFKYGDYSNYDLYGMWEAAGKPNSFEEVKDKEFFPLQDDGLYHGYSVGKDGIVLKSKSHPSIVFEALASQLSPDIQNQLLIQREDGRLQYVPKKQTGGNIYDKETDNLLAQIASMIADGEDPDMVAGSLVDNGYSEEVVDSLVEEAIDRLTELGDYEEEDINQLEDIKVLREGGIPDRYKNQGFTKVGAKRKSNRPGKKWMVLAKKGNKYKIVHGGYKGMKDYTQHGSEERRERFWDRMGGKNSSKAKDPFSPLYWHKRFGTWQDGGKTPIEHPEGQRKFPGKTTRIPSNRITMEGINYPVLAIGDNGKANLMLPGEEYLYLGVNYVDEVPFSK